MHQFPPSLPPHKIKHRESQKRQMCQLLPTSEIYPLPIHCFDFPDIKPCWPPDYVGRAENSNVVLKHRFFLNTLFHIHMEPRIQ